MLADKYADAVHAVLPSVDVKLIDGVNHMGIVSTPKAVNAIADYVATQGAAVRKMIASGAPGNSIMIDRNEASAALSDINDIVRRVRQSRIYDLASLIMIMWGGLVCAGNLATFLSSSYGGYIWIAVNVLGVAGTAVLSAFDYRRTGVRTFDWRVLATFLLFFAFGLFAACARPFRSARAGSLLADLFHAVLLHRRTVVRPRLHRASALASPS